MANFFNNIGKWVNALLTRVFGSRNQRLLRQYGKVVVAINALEEEMQALQDGDFPERTRALRERVGDTAELDDVIPEAFALVREASRRSLGLRHFDVQLIGGMVLHDGKIAEMRTGEGKTLVATLTVYLNTLGGHGVHIVTVNEYLAARDAEWMRPIYEFLGLTVGVIKSGQTPQEKREAYQADVTYGTNNEFGFDYLRDNLAFRLEDRAQRELSYAIVDEVDSILIDEARTPLIISGPSEESTDLYNKINKLIPKLKVQMHEGATRNREIEAAKVALLGLNGESLGEKPLAEAIELADQAGADLVQTARRARPPVCQLVAPGDYSIDEKGKQAHLTERGHQEVETLLAQAGLLEDNASLYDAANIRLMHHLTAALRANALFKRDVDYIVKDGEVVIVDEFTGRTMPGRRWSDGLHQAIEAKESVTVKEENQTVASITFQNYFRMYNKLAGMTGTADTEAYEFQQIYGLEVVVIPTHMAMIRDDAPDLVYLMQKDKFHAIIDDIKDCHERGQPVLVGTTSIETSELLAGLLKKQSVPHRVLNAKHHAKEAEIVAEAGRPGKITIATNMAGRGTDIVLGGNLEAELAERELGETEEAGARGEWQQRHAAVLEAGGLHIVGTERHESRRIDNQLRGRSGRQGDPGSSRFFLSMEDNLMRIFGNPERTKSLLARVGMQEDEAIESRLLTRQIERAQRKVEEHNFDARKNLLEYDDVANDQRKVVYLQRTELMAADEIEDSVRAIREEVVHQFIDGYIAAGSVEELWDVPALGPAVEREFSVQLDPEGWLKEDEGLDEDALRARIVDEIGARYDSKVEAIGEPVMRHFEKAIMLQQLDFHWKEHLAAMDYLRQGIFLRSFAQKNPKQEYKREAFEMFSEMLDQVKHDVISILSKVQLRGEQDVEAVEAKRRASQSMKFQHASAPSLDAGAPPLPPAAEPVEPFVRTERKIGRNEPCPCGSGKKYKHCHGRLS